MTKRPKPIVEAFSQEDLPYFWVPARVPRCPHAACRRAGKCVRPRLIVGRPRPDWPSCPLVSDREWAAWGINVARLLICLTAGDDPEAAAAVFPGHPPRRLRRP
ncbi:MAG TPA: hypothetical protein VHG92_10635 [Afifellaceae bacterium]|nr:hypothetical protein [Afifellaceae bacterium]